MANAFILVVLGSSVAAISSYWLGRLTVRLQLRHREARDTSLRGSVIRIFYGLPCSLTALALSTGIYAAIWYTGVLENLVGLVSIFPLLSILIFGCVGFSRGIDAEARK